EAPHPPRSYADVLRRTVLRRADLLANGLRAWRALLDAIRPDAMVFDAAPLALLASRERAFRRVIFDSGWSVPTPTTPLPALGDHVSLADREAAEADAMEVVREGCRLARMTAPPHLAALNDVDATLIRQFEALSPYPPHPGHQHVGPALYTDRGESPRWPEGDGPKVFAYLH